MADLDYFSLSESTLKELAGQGDAEAMIALGIGYYFGSFGVPPMTGFSKHIGRVRRRQLHSLPR